MTYAQTGAANQVDPVFNAKDMDGWSLGTGYAKLDDIEGNAIGTAVLAKHKRTGTKIIAVMRDGKIAQVGMMPQRGSFKVLTPNANPCYKPLCYSFQIVHCYTLPWGECVCVCGAWITAG